MTRTSQANTGAGSFVGRIIRVVLGVAIMVAIVYSHRLFADALNRTVFLTGWILFAGLAVEFVRRCIRLKTNASAQRLVAQHCLLSIAVVMLFLVHIEFAWPNGVFDLVLTGLFLAVLATGTIGAVLWRRLRSERIAGAIPVEQAGKADRCDSSANRAVRRWLMVHVPCVACLLALGSMHGVISHTHGLLAHFLLEK